MHSKVLIQWPCLALLMLSTIPTGGATDGEVKPPSEPELISVFPLGGKSGDGFEIQVRGIALQDVHGVWFECADVSGEVESIESIAPAAQQGEADEYVEQREARHLVRVKVQTEPRAETGLHLFRLVSPQGVSNALAIHLLPQSLLMEGQTTHPQAALSRPLDLPAAVNGRLEEKGEVDFYSFAAAAGEEWLFLLYADVYPITYLPPAEIGLHEMVESWFDRNRIRRLPVQTSHVSWERLHRFRSKDNAAQFRILPRLRHRFDRTGEYFVTVNGFLGGVGTHHFYQLVIVPAGDPNSARLKRRFDQLAHRDPADWLERDATSWKQVGSFGRPLRTDRLQVLTSRSVGPRKAPPSNPLLHPPSFSPSGAAAVPIPRQSEQEPNEGPDAAIQIAVPGILEGAIQSPGDLDTFRLQVKEGQKLAFEIETPEKAPPLFNPWLKVLDSNGRPVVSNIFKEYGGDGDDVNKMIERKTIYRFQEAGDFYLQIRDLTSRLGGSEYRYRLLVRPQVPHVGRMEVSLGVRSQLSQLITLTDRMNLIPGQARKFTLICEKEEGFEGELSIRVKDLPAGVRAYPGTPAGWTDILMRGIQYRPTDDLIMDPSNHRPKREILTIVLAADQDAPATREPRLVRVEAQPIRDGKIGLPLAAGRFPVTVLEAPPPGPASDKIALNQERANP